MAVPAAMMSMGSSVCISALTITNVSSQSDTFFGKSSSGQCMDDEGPVADAFAGRQYGFMPQV